jgi:hypothetical protein
MARYADEGQTSYLIDLDIIDLVLVHIGYDPHGWEAPLAYHSPLISFSTSRDRALKFANRRNKKLEQCNFENATYFLWRFEPIVEATDNNGIYKFQYFADPINFESIVLGKIDRGSQELSLTDHIENMAKAVGELLAQNHSKHDTSIHIAYLIDVQEYLKHIDLSKYNNRLANNTLARSNRDIEWLVVPYDPLPNGNGRSARIHLNRHLYPDGWFREKQKAG